MVAWMGPLATIIREPGQAWKGAATAVDLGAGVWLVQVAALLPFFDTNFTQYLAFDAYLNTENRYFALQCAPLVYA